MSKLLRIVEVGMLLMVPAVLLLCALLHAQRTALLSLLAVSASAIPFFLSFERRRPRARDVMPIVVMAAIAAAGRIIFAPFPSFKPVSAIVIVSGLCFGSQSGYLTGALAALSSNMLFGQGPWTPWQMYAWGLIGFLAGHLGKRRVFRRPVAVYIFGFLSGFIYSLFLDTWAALGFLSPASALPSLLAVYAAGLPFTLSHSISTALFLIALYVPWQRKLLRIREKYGLGNH